MDRADILISEVLKESLLRDVTRGVGAYMVGKAAYNATRKVIPKVVAAATSPAARAAARAAGSAAMAAAPTIGRAIKYGAPLVAGYYAMRAADRATGR